MAMKKCIILFMAAILASCSDTQLAESIADVKESELVKENANGSAESRLLLKEHAGVTVRPICNLQTATGTVSV